MKPPLKTRFSIAIRMGFLAAVFCLISCGKKLPPLAPVSGTVTMDGVPLRGAAIYFAPQESGARGVRATTDARGQYTLEYEPGIPGAALGEYRVRIFHFRDLIPQDVQEGGPASPMYEAGSELPATVKAGANTIDFALQSQE